MYSSCQKCTDFDEKVRKAPTISGSGLHPTTLELAYMVNFEYYVDINYDCVHKIPESKSAKIKISEMIKFLEEKHWELVTRTNYEGKIKLIQWIFTELGKKLGFKCSSFLNHPAKQLVIVHRGTELTNLWQIGADIKIALNKITSDIVKKADWHTVQSLLNNALKLDEKTRKHVRNNYSVTITGHSLGGWLAQLCTLLSKYPKFFPVGPRGTFYFGNDTMLDMNQSYDLHCVAFDSPGANAVLTRLKEDPAWLNGEPRDVEIAFKDLDITVYLANRNLVNMCGTHMETVKTIDVMSDASFLTKWFNPVASHSMEGILTYFQSNPNA